MRPAAVARCVAGSCSRQGNFVGYIAVPFCPRLSHPNTLPALTVVQRLVSVFSWSCGWSSRYAGHSRRHTSSASASFCTRKTRSRPSMSRRTPTASSCGPPCRSQPGKRKCMRVGGVIWPLFCELSIFIGHRQSCHVDALYLLEWEGRVI